MHYEILNSIISVWPASQKQYRMYSYDRYVVNNFIHILYILNLHMKKLYSEKLSHAGNCLLDCDILQSCRRTLTFEKHAASIFRIEIWISRRRRHALTKRLYPPTRLDSAAKQTTTVATSSHPVCSSRALLCKVRRIQGNEMYPCKTEGCNFTDYIMEVYVFVELREPSTQQRSKLHFNNID